MAILHNLSNIADNLSCLDPVAAYSDGTSIGKSWLMWKLVDALTQFDSNVKVITNASPTPTFLQSEAGTALQTEPALNRSVAGDFIRIYFADDIGLTQTPANAKIIEFKITDPSNNNVFTMRQRFKIDGQVTYAPGADDAFIVSNSAAIDASVLYIDTTFSARISTMNYIPKYMFWKSSNALAILTISKIDGISKGGILFLRPSWQGYKHNVGAITEGVDINAMCGINARNGHYYCEGFSQSFTESSTTIPNTNSTPIILAGNLPTQLFNFNSINNLIGSKFRWSLKNNTIFKIVSSEFEGLIVANSSAVNLTRGTIYLYNNTYYMVFGSMLFSETQKILLQLN